MRTVVLNLTQKISAISCPSRQTLPPERSLRSAHRLSAELHSKTDVCGRTESSAPTGCCVSVKSRLPAIIKIACGAASEEASCIALPPGRRKLHIRWLLLPFRKPTAALGRLSVTIRKEREPSKPEVQTVPPSCNSSVVRPYLPAPNHPTRSDYAPHAILMMAGRRLLTNIATSELRCMK